MPAPAEITVEGRALPAAPAQPSALSRWGLMALGALLGFGAGTIAAWWFVRSREARGSVPWWWEGDE